MDWTEFCEKVAMILGVYRVHLSFNYDDSKICFVISSQKYQYTSEEYNELNKKAEKYDFECFACYNDMKYESLVDIPDTNNKRYFSFSFEDKISELALTDEDAKIKYSFNEISEELIWYIIKNYDSQKRVTPKLPFRYFIRKCESLETKNLFSIIRLTIRTPISICIDSNTPNKTEHFKRYAKAYLFNLAYNFDLVFKTVTEIDDIFPQRTFTSRRRFCSASELMAPQLLYNEELTEQYYMSLTSEDPFVKFIGFYHIMEHFYEKVYRDDILHSVQHIIQHPGFSAKRSKDINKIVELINKKTKQNKIEFQGSELEALELTLKKFVDITELVNELTEFDKSIVEYYATVKVSFSNGDITDLRDVTNEKLYKKLAARIYKTRNALVHSKSNENRIKERGIYKPFNNSHELSMEIPLMRYIAEQIIINSATSL